MSGPHSSQLARHDDPLTLPRAGFAFLLGNTLRRWSWRLALNLRSRDVKPLRLGTTCPLRVVCFHGNPNSLTHHCLNILSYTGLEQLFLNLFGLNLYDWDLDMYGGDHLL